jgi:hypothetical protein
MLSHWNASHNPSQHSGCSGWRDTTRLHNDPCRARGAPGDPGAPGEIPKVERARPTGLSTNFSSFYPDHPDHPEQIRKDNGHCVAGLHFPTRSTLTRTRSTGSVAAFLRVCPLARRGVSR